MPPIASFARENTAPWAPETLWHALRVEDICERLRCGKEGLSEDIAQARLAEYGENRLPEPPPPSLWRVLLRQFTSPLIYILLVAAAVSLALGLLDDAAFIAAVLAINALIGFLQEYRAERDIQSLNRLLRSVVRVQRDGRMREIGSEALVPGDLVLLESGLRVPADLRILESRGLRLDESLLTGESLPAEKRPETELPGPTPLAERKNMLFSGTTILQGRGLGLIVGTALDTQVGRIALAMHAAKPVKPPLVIRMERFSRRIGGAVLLLAGVVFALGLLHGMAWHEILMSALALAVSAIPEGLPVALTVALAIGVKRMARRHVLVRHMEAVEGLGSCSVIGTDKTGTLTKNELTVVAGIAGGAPFAVHGVGYAPGGRIEREGETLLAQAHPLLARLARAGALCNEASLAQSDGEWRWNGDPTDVALLALAHKAGLEPAALVQRHPQTNAIPFEPERRFAASFHREAPPHEARGLVVAKGAPERIFGLCDGMWLAASPGPVPLDRALAQSWVEALTRQGYRVLALAEREEPAFLEPAATPEEPAGLKLIGLVGMTDPPRDRVRQAIGAAHAAGIRVAMITGDHLETAKVIGRQIGLTDGDPEGGQDAIDCKAIHDLDEEGLRDAVPRYRVFARATPEDKLRIVRAWQASGEFVAVTGDGVNDAPALRAANIGVAMGRSGTDVARDSAGMVITDDDFSSIVAGVEEGRATYDNVRKVIYLLVSTGLGEVLMVLMAMIAGLPVPFVPAQLLWLNLVTNGIQDVALAFEPKERGLLRRPPRPPREPVFNRIMVERTVIAALVFGIVSFALFARAIEGGLPLETARNLNLNLFVLFEIFHIGNCRSETHSLFRINPISNRLLFLGTLSAILLHAFALYWTPLAGILRVAPLSPAEWAELAALAAVILAVMEAHKLMRLWWPLPGTVHGGAGGAHSGAPRAAGD